MDKDTSDYIESLKRRAIDTMDSLRKNANMANSPIYNEMDMDMKDLRKAYNFYEKGAESLARNAKSQMHLDGVENPVEYILDGMNIQKKIKIGREFFNSLLKEDSIVNEINPSIKESDAYSNKLFFDIVKRYDDRLDEVGISLDDDTKKLSDEYLIKKDASRKQRKLALEAKLQKEEDLLEKSIQHTVPENVRKVSTGSTRVKNNANALPLSKEENLLEKSIIGSVNDRERQQQRELLERVQSFNNNIGDVIAKDTQTHAEERNITDDDRRIAEQSRTNPRKPSYKDEGRARASEANQNATLGAYQSQASHAQEQKQAIFRQRLNSPTYQNRYNKLYDIYTNSVKNNIFEKQYNEIFKSEGFSEYMRQNKVFNKIYEDIAHLDIDPNKANSMWQESRNIFNRHIFDSADKYVKYIGEQWKNGKISFEDLPKSMQGKERTAFTNELKSREKNIDLTKAFKFRDDVYKNLADDFDKYNGISTGYNVSDGKSIFKHIRQHEKAIKEFADKEGIKDISEASNKFFSQIKELANDKSKITKDVLNKYGTYGRQVIQGIQDGATEKTLGFYQKKINEALEGDSILKSGFDKSTLNKEEQSLLYNKNTYRKGSLVRLGNTERRLSALKGEPIKTSLEAAPEKAAAKVFGGKVAKGAIGLLATVGIAHMMFGGGRQSNAQLYNQQQQYPSNY